MTDTQTITNKQATFVYDEPPKYNVIMHNDDVTPMDFVVDVLCNIFRKPKDDAETLMLRIHNEGSAVVGTYFKDIAESKTRIALELARKNGFPLKITIERV